MKYKEMIIWSVLFLLGCGFYGVTRQTVIRCNLHIIPYDGTKTKALACNCTQIKDGPVACYAQ